MSCPTLPGVLDAPMTATDWGAKMASRAFMEFGLSEGDTDVAIACSFPTGFLQDKNPDHSFKNHRLRTGSVSAYHEIWVIVLQKLPTPMLRDVHNGKSGWKNGLQDLQCLTDFSPKTSRKWNHPEIGRQLRG
jgi:hypothetical protein